MIGDVSETTPLLGEASTSHEVPNADQESAPESRIHFLDNLRAALTVLLIYHHAAIFAGLDALGTPTYSKLSSMLPVAVFAATNKAFLYSMFFFVSGYSIHLGLKAKSDSTFLISRTVKIGLPALIWLHLSSLLDTVKHIVSIIFGENPFGHFGMFGSLIMDRRRKVEGPGAYVFTLLLFDCAYLLARFVGRHYPTLSFSRLESHFKASRRWVFGLFAFSVILVTGVTIGNCFDLRLIPSTHGRFFLFEYPGFGAPVTYIIAYIAGINFPIVKQYILLSRSKVAAIHLGLLQLIAYISLALAALVWPELWDFIVPATDSEGARYFDGAGFNGHTLFFSIWNPAVFYLLSILIISVFTCSPVLQKNLGTWTEHTYIQTFIHMIPVAFTAHLLSLYSFTNVPVVKAILSGSCGVLVSWGVAVTFVLLRRKFGRYIPSLPEVDIQVSIRRREAEAAEDV